MDNPEIEIRILSLEELGDPLFTGKAPALYGPCFITDGNFKPLKKTRKGWQQYADRQAAKMQPAGFWNGVVGYVPHRSAYRINYGGQPEKH